VTLVQFPCIRLYNCSQSKHSRRTEWLWFSSLSFDCTTVPKVNTRDELSGSGSVPLHSTVPTWEASQRQITLVLCENEAGSPCFRLGQRLHPCSTMPTLEERDAVQFRFAPLRRYELCVLQQSSAARFSILKGRHGRFVFQQDKYFNSTSIDWVYITTMTRRFKFIYVLLTFWEKTSHKLLGVMQFLTKYTDIIF
jgi:hypothetical protein